MTPHPLSVLRCTVLALLASGCAGSGSVGTGQAPGKDRRPITPRPR
jgi:hypothetical protein